MTDRESVSKRLQDFVNRHPMIDADTSYELCQEIEAALSEAPGEPSEERDYTPEEALAEANKRFSSGGKNAVAVEVYLSKWDEIPEMKQTPPKYKISGIYKNQEFTGDSFRACFAEADKLQIVDGQPVSEGSLE